MEGFKFITSDVGGEQISWHSFYISSDGVKGHGSRIEGSISYTISNTARIHRVK